MTSFLARLWRRVNIFSFPFFVGGVLLNHVLGYFILSEAAAQGKLSGRLEPELNTEGSKPRSSAGCVSVYEIGLGCVGQQRA